MSRANRYAKYIVIVAVFFGATSGIFSKLITANAVAIGFYRLSFAMPLLIFPLGMRGWQDLKETAPKDAVLSCLSGLFLFGHFASWFAAVKMTTIASGIVLAALHPLVVIMILIFIFKKKISPLAIIGIISALAGGTIVAGFDYSFSKDNALGNLLALSAAINMGIYFVMGDRLRNRVSASAYIFWAFLACWFMFMISMVVTDTPFTGYPREDWLWFVMATLCCQFGAHGLFNWSMGYVSSLYVSAWETGEIVFATVLAFVVFGEIPTVWQAAGAVIVIFGLMLYHFKSGEAMVAGGTEGVERADFAEVDNKI